MARTSTNTLPSDHQVEYLHGSRLTRRRASELTPVKAIRAKCLDCSGGSPGEVAQCVIHTCPLFAYRFGKRPVFGPTPSPAQNRVFGEVAHDSARNNSQTARKSSRHGKPR